MQRFFKENGALVWRGNGETLVLEPWGPDSLRLRSRMMGDILDDDFALLPNPPAHGPVQIEVEDQRASITNGKIRAELDYDPWFRNCRVHYYNQEGKLLLEEAFNYGGLKKYAREFIPLPGGDYRLTLNFEAPEDEKLFGMGQYQQEYLDLKYSVVEMSQRNTQVSVPFLLSSRGYGFLWHNPAVGKATFAKNFTQWQADASRQADYWITAGDSPAEIITRYASVTGTAPMMPEYGLGFWQCRLRYWNQEQLLEVAREYKRRGLPLDVIVVDFFHWPKMGDFRFDPEFFPNPKAMVDELKEMGVELMVSVWPQIALTSENYEEMRQQGLLVRAERGNQVTMQWPEDSTFYDATNPRARAYVWEKCKKNYYDYGIRIFWLDEAEPEYGVCDFDNYRYHLGNASRVSNIYPQLYARGFYEGMEQAGQKNIVNLIRCAWAGSQRYGALVWSGDIDSTWVDFRRQICAGLNISLAGIPWWTTDIGGFSGGDPTDPAFQELLVRWFQFGAFCPVMRLHGDRVPSKMIYNKAGDKVMHAGADNEIWSFGEENYQVLRKYLLFRETMRPYVRQLMQEAHETGAPVMRAMFYQFPEDAKCWELTDQYCFGPDVLVAPVTQPGAAERTVYLPAGCGWTSLHDGARYEGGQTVTASSPLEVIPVFLREGTHQEWIKALDSFPVFH